MGQLLPVEVIERAQSPEYDLKDLQAFISAQEKRLSEKADNANDNERSASHLDGEQLLNKARRADSSLDALYRGNWKGRYASQSEAAGRRAIVHQLPGRSELIDHQRAASATEPSF